MDKLEGSENVFNDSWNSFVAGELEVSNERNRRNLGGRPTSRTSEDDETNQFDVNMDNIMKRFKCFNTLVQNNSSTDDDDKDDKEDKDQKEEEEDTINEPEGEGEGRGQANNKEAKIEVVLP